MHVHIARQPIFTANKQVFAYELLFRQTMGLQLGELSGDRATGSLLSATFLTEGIEQISGNKPCFINFTQNLLELDIARSFPHNMIVVEILEDVLPTAEVIEACRCLSELGYRLALDDFVFREDLLPLIDRVDILKLDYRLSTASEIEAIFARFRGTKLEYLAEKIETYEEFDHARQLGFHYFQGYFFSKPQAIRINDVTSVATNLLQLLSEVNKPDTTVRKLEQIVATDLAISYKLLRYINSSAFYLLREVDSIRQAIIYLGEKEIRRFVTLVIVAEMAVDKPTELVRLSLIRARFCELLAGAGRVKVDGAKLFLLGLFSLIDAVLDSTMTNLMEKLPLAEEIKQALLDGSGPLPPFLRVVTAYEQGNDQDCLETVAQLGINPEILYEMYLEAIKFSSIID